MGASKLPDWATKEEHYEPKADREAFISRSLLRVIGVLSVMELQSSDRAPKNFSPFAALGFAALLILLCASSHASAFLLCVLAMELVLLCLLPGEKIVVILRRSLPATLLGFILALPALWLNRGVLMMLLPAKTFLTVTALGLLTYFFPWHDLTAALRFFRLPEVVIFILDTTLRYIVLLGRQAHEILIALKIRSVGRNPQKGKAVAGVLGVTFLRSREMSEETYRAMCCRCFTGEYPRTRREKFRPGDALLLLCACGYVLLFFRLEGVGL